MVPFFERFAVQSIPSFKLVSADGTVLKEGYGPKAFEALAEYDAGR